MCLLMAFFGCPSVTFVPCTVVFILEMADRPVVRGFIIATDGAHRRERSSVTARIFIPSFLQWEMWSFLQTASASRPARSARSRIMQLPHCLRCVSSGKCWQVSRQTKGGNLNRAANKFWNILTWTLSLASACTAQRRPSVHTQHAEVCEFGLYVPSTDWTFHLLFCILWSYEHRDYIRWFRIYKASKKSGFFKLLFIILH